MSNPSALLRWVLLPKLDLNQRPSENAFVPSKLIDFSGYQLLTEKVNLLIKLSASLTASFVKSLHLITSAFILIKKSLIISGKKKGSGSRKTRGKG